MDYILRISGGFNKGECTKCPIHPRKKGAIECNRFFNNCPLEEVKQGEEKQGKWIADRYCSECEYDSQYMTSRFCPECGTKMKGGK